MVLALLLLLRDACVPLPKGTISFSGLFSFLTNLPSYYENTFKDPVAIGLNGDILRELIRTIFKYIPLGVYETLKYNPLVSPLFGDFKRVTPIQFFVARDEVNRDGSVAMYEKCLQDGVHAELIIQDHGLHAWNVWYYLDETKAAFVEMNRFILQVGN